MVDFTFKIGGEAGFGIATSGLVFSKIASRLGLNIFDFIEYPSLIRGGHNAYEVRVSRKKIFHLKSTIDVLVCLNQETFRLHQHRLNQQSFVIYDPDEFNFEENFLKIDVPFSKILKELNGQTVMKNTIALGACLALLGSKIDPLDQIIESQFRKKGQEIIDFNKKFALVGYQYIKNHYPQLINNWLNKNHAYQSNNKLVLSGNDAFSLAAIMADCRFYAAYPMTPSSSILTTLASWQKKTKMVVRHAEDEISAINTAFGASFAGVRSSVGTSGGGFALMVETLSLAGITETPIVVFLAQRPGPATGMPTWTEQGDLLFTINAGHGEFFKIVLAPGDQEEMIDLTLKAFNLADIYQTPVIILSDMFLSESHQTVDKISLEKIFSHHQINRGKLILNLNYDLNNIDSTTYQLFPRYQNQPDGISPRLIPGHPNFFYQINSYEHQENGHTTEDAKERIIQVKKRNNKIKTYLERDFSLPKIYGDLRKSGLVFISWGSNKGAILEAQNILAEKGINTAFFHFSYVYPLHKEKIVDLINNPTKKYLLIENNSWGQFSKLITQETGIAIQNKLLKYDGRPVNPEEIINFVRNLNLL